MADGEALTLASRWARICGSLADPALRLGFIRDELSRHEPGLIAAAVEALEAAAAAGDLGARDALGALVPALAQDTRAASPAERPPARQEGSETLGARKALARRPDRKAVEKATRDPHPAVIRNLLPNPALTEDDVVRIAARRPAQPPVLREIARSTRWSLRPRVRLALALNPHTPLPIALSIVDVLGRADLVAVGAAEDLDATVRAAARVRLARPPRQVTPQEPTEDPPLITPVGADDRLN